MLRDAATPSGTFRALATELVILIGVEATRHLPTEEVEVVTPVTTTIGRRLAEPKPLLVPILRAGLGLLEGMSRVLPTAEVGFLGMVRDEETLQPKSYAARLPKDLTDRHVFLLDPMLATGGSLIASIDEIWERGPASITAVCLIAAPEGVAAVEAAAGDREISVVVAALDEKLNEVGYIVPGLGDAGDRLYGTAD